MTDSPKRLLAELESHWAVLASGLAEREGSAPAAEQEHAARQFVEQAIFLAMCRRRGLAADNALLLPATAPPLDGTHDFARQPADWLGRVHEHLLGRRLAGGDGRLRVVAAPEAKKAAGIFYTPECVVDYIVQRSLGRLLAERPPASAEPAPTVIDPACGSGAFLTAACRVLLQWCGNTPGVDGPQVAAGAVYGMDLDADAVLAARRSLWLTLVDACPAKAAGGLAGRLCENVRCSDSLADAAAPGAGPFDVVLGNPPYRRELGTKPLLDRVAATRLGRLYRQARMDLWYYFVHRGLELAKPGGRLAMIVGSYWTAGAGSQKLLVALQSDARIEEIFLLDRLRVFSGVGGRHMILTLRKGPAQGAEPTTIKTVPKAAAGDAEPYVSGRCEATRFEKTAEQLFRFGRIDLEPPADALVAKIGRGEPLGRLGLVRQGIVENPASVTAATNLSHGNRWRNGEGVFALTDDELARLDLDGREAALVRPYHDLCDLGRHFLAHRPSLSLIYSTAPTCADIDRFPVLRRHLARFRPIMEARRETRRGARPWWQLHWPRDERVWQSAKVISIQMGRRPAFVAATRPVYVPFSTNVFVPNEPTREHVNYFAAVLNSRLIWKWCRHFAKRRGVGLEINGHLLRRMPIRRIDFASNADCRRHDELVELTDRMMTLAHGKREPAGRSPSEIDAALAETDRRIDELVYEIYTLTDAEQAAVDEAEL